MAVSDPYSERTNLWVVLAAIIVALLGLLLLYLAGNWQWLVGNPGIQTVVRELGGLLVASVAIAMLWELAAKRAFLSEIMAKSKLVEDVRTAGLVSIPKSFYRGTDWSQLFARVNKLDIFFAYGRTWRGSFSAELHTLAQRPGARVRVVLPDPDDDTLMLELARRFEITPDEVSNLIRGATDDFIEIFSETPQAVAEFSLWYHRSCPVFSFYRFDHVVILALYKHRRGRGEVPTIVVEKGGTLYNFVREEFDAFIREPDGLARQYFPTVQQMMEE